MALHAAARNGDMDALRAAIAGSDLDGKDKLSRTALHLAAWAGQTEVVRLLIAHGCNVSAAAEDDVNALHFAAQKGHVEAARLLLNAGIHVNSRTRKGMTALAMAAQNGHTGVVELLLKRKASASTSNTKGQTPLELAKGDQVKALLEAALAAGADATQDPEAGEGGPGTGPPRAKKLRGAQKGGQLKKPSAPEPGGEPTDNGQTAHGDEGNEAGEGVMIGPALGPMAAAAAVHEETEEGGMIGPALGPRAAGSDAQDEQHTAAEGSAQVGPAAAEDDMGPAGVPAGSGQGGSSRAPDQQPPEKKQKIVLSFGDEDE